MSSNGDRVLAAGTGDRRRGKTALFLVACGCAGAAPHWLDPTRSLIPSLTLALVLGGYSLSTTLRGSDECASPANGLPEKDAEGASGLQSAAVESATGSSRSETSLTTTSAVNESFASWPTVDVVVAARDEEAVVARLMERLGALRYPADQLTTWIVDDGSEDKTPDLLDDLKSQYPNLNVIRRQRNAGGGKSGALNAALAESSGEWILVLDADGQISDDQLERLIPIAVMGGWSGVQMRKAVTNADTNWLTRVQAMEMAFDALIQQGRLLGGGVSELRGNGQLLRRDVLEACGGFNEDTVTDDLDLSFRFLLQGARTTLLWNPPVREEAVETVAALWKQRQRWAEGGLQRFFDYWPGLLSNRLTLGQRRDLACFFLLQYALPVLSFADLVTSVFTRTSPVYWPLSIVAFGVSGVAYWRGCRRSSEGPALPQPDPFSLLLGIAYLSHWFFVIPWVTLRMAVLPKSLVWAKTSHRGTEETVKA